MSANGDKPSAGNEHFCGKLASSAFSSLSAARIRKRERREEEKGEKGERKGRRRGSDLKKGENEARAWNEGESTGE